MDSPTSRGFTRRCQHGNNSSGFSLIELMVTLAMFLVICGAAFSLVVKHMPLFTSQQNQAGLNFGLRNAVAQVQIDGANAGSGFYNAADIPGWPIGITIEPGSGDNCYDASTHTYGPGCFDRLNIIKIDPAAPPATVTQSSGDATSSVLWVDNSYNPSISLSTIASSFKSGDTILILAPDGSTMTTTTLSKDGAVAGAKVQLQHNPTGDGGVTSSLNDYYDIATHANNKLGSNFPDGSWVLKLDPAVYTVDATDLSDPKLARLSPSTPGCEPVDPSTGALREPPYDSNCVVADQIIGFKVGAALNEDIQGCGEYCYRPELFGADGYDWTQIRALRITLIGRTPPNGNSSQPQNTFDFGPYKIEAVSVMIDPRSVTGLAGQHNEQTTGTTLQN